MWTRIISEEGKKTLVELQTDDGVVHYLREVSVLYLLSRFKFRDAYVFYRMKRMYGGSR